MDSHVADTNINRITVEFKIAHSILTAIGVFNINRITVEFKRNQSAFLTFSLCLY